MKLYRRLRNGYSKHTPLRPRTQYDWLELGVKNKWCCRPVCGTHDMVPMSPEEEAEWDEGNDPCQYIVRVDEWE